MMILLCLGQLMYQVDLEAIEGTLQGNFSCWQAGYLSISQDGFLVNLHDKILVYDHEGYLQKTVEAEHKVLSMVLLRDHLVLTGWHKARQEMETLSVPLDRKGLSNAKVVNGNFRTLQVVDDELYGSFFDYRNKKGQYPYLYHKIDPLSLETTESMFKIPKVLDMDFKLFWVASCGDALVFVNQTENRVYFSTDLVRQKEKILSDSIRGISPYLELEYGRETQFEPNFQLTDFDRNERSQLRWAQKRFRYSFNLFFAGVGDGYVICFEVPDKLDGLYLGNHLGIRFLDERFQPLGPLIERYGQIMGVHDGAAYVFYPNGEILIPDGEASVRAHYGLTSVNSVTLGPIFDMHWQFSKPARFKPVVEFIYPDF